jgi:hypothetical protein
MGEAVNRNGMTSLEVTLGSEGQFLESPLQENLHGGFGGGGEETQFGCAPCPYLTIVLGGRESRLQGEGRQGIDIRRTK